MTRTDTKIYGILHYYVRADGTGEDPSEEVIDEIGAVPLAEAKKALCEAAAKCGPVGDSERGYEERVDLVELEGAGPVYDSDVDVIAATHAPACTVVQWTEAQRLMEVAR